MSLRPVVIAGTGSFLPGPPISNDKVEQVLGELTDAPAKVKSFVGNIGQKMLDRGGVNTRHFAVDPETGEMTHNFSMLAEQAARRALDMAGMEPQELDMVMISCPSYDQSTPPTSALLQERLGIQNVAEFEIHSNCSGVGKCTQIAFDAIRSGRYKSALISYSQLSSIYLRSCYFNQPKMDKVHAALRWILADGAGAMVLKAGEDGEPEHRIVDTFVESVGAGRPAGMVAGGAAADLMKPDHQIPELYGEGEHHLWQDFTAVNENAAPLLLQGLLNFTTRMKIDPSTVDHYVVSIPTTQLYEDHIPAFLDKLGITRDKIKFRSDRIGYCGGSATLLHFDEMVREGEIKKGDLAVVHAVESSKVDDGRLRGSMVERQSSEPKPYALRATVYTVGFLLVVFGVIPSFFYIGEQYLLVKDAPKLPEDESLFWYYAAVFWRDFRALAGVAIFSMGMAAYIYCSVWLITYGKGPHVEFDHPKEFVCDGPYRWVRNPVVIALIVTAVGMALYLASWGVAVFVLLGMAFAHWQATKIEEPNLTERFGKSYTDYCQRVNRWIPRPPSKD